MQRFLITKSIFFFFYKFSSYKKHISAGKIDAPVPRNKLEHAIYHTINGELAISLIDIQVE